VRRVKDIPISPQIASLLETPTWSVASLLPPGQAPTTQSDNTTGLALESSPATDATEAHKEITSAKLHHLLKLSALPPPKDREEEDQMLRDLRDQVHFVKQIQKVDTRGVKPLVAIRDETSEYREEQTISVNRLHHFIKLEEKKGTNGTIRRNKAYDHFPDLTFHRRPQRWSTVPDPWATGKGADSRKMGKFFYVQRKQDGKDETRSAEKKIEGMDVH
jgi:aspartyl/glutamyl-tRNA(Asn/Gln) amidotransferase C subunit